MSDENKEIKQTEKIKKEVSVDDLKKLHETLVERIKGLEERLAVSIDPPKKIDVNNKPTKAPLQEKEEPKKETKIIDKEPVVRDEAAIINPKKKQIVNTSRVVKGVFV